MTAGWRVETSSRARRDLRNLDPPVRTRVLDAIDRLVADPPTGDVVKLQGQDRHRLRVGDWRVLLRLDSNAKATPRRTQLLLPQRWQHTRPERLTRGGLPIGDDEAATGRAVASCFVVSTVSGRWLAGSDARGPFDVRRRMRWVRGRAAS